VFWSKTFNSSKERIVAICDEELLGKTLRQGKLQVTITESFYGGCKVDEATAKDMMKKSTSGNLFGKRIVELAEEAGFITKKSVIVIDGIPHAQFIRV